MSEQTNYIITIGRQLGSGGAMIGKEIADHYGFLYLDREILVRASDELGLPEQSVESVDERVVTMWHQIFSSGKEARPKLPEYAPTARKLFETETKILKDVAKHSSCVVVGRCGNWIFKDTPNHVGFFLYAHGRFRMENLMNTFSISETEARERIAAIDKDRARYYTTYTDKQWSDMKAYDMSIDSGKLGLEMTAEVLIHYLQKRFPDLKTSK